jgi:hypothetical protein
VVGEEFKVVDSRTSRSCDRTISPRSSEFAYRYLCGQVNRAYKANHVLYKVQVSCTSLYLVHPWRDVPVDRTMTISHFVRP